MGCKSMAKSEIVKLGDRHAKPVEPIPHVRIVADGEELWDRPGPFLVHTLPRVRDTMLRLGRPVPLAPLLLDQSHQVGDQAPPFAPADGLIYQVADRIAGGEIAGKLFQFRVIRDQGP